MIVSIDEKIKPCPKCKSTSVKFMYIPVYSNTDWSDESLICSSHYIECNVCGFSKQNRYDDKQKAIDEWNKQSDEV